MKVERCICCDAETGKAGRDDDSLYDRNELGPYCEDCWSELTDYQRGEDA